MIRHGDIVIRRVAEIPNDAKPIKGKSAHILAEGEVTGHAHKVCDTIMSQLYEMGTDKFLEVKSPCVVEHEEHAPVTLDPGLYRITRQREFDGEFYRNVAD